MAEDRRRLVALRVLELAVKRDHPLPPDRWAAVRRAARRGEEAPDDLKPAVRAEAAAVLASSDLGIAPVWLLWGFAALGVLTLASWFSSRSGLSLLMVLLYALIVGGSYLGRKTRKAGAEAALLRNADPL